MLIQGQRNGALGSVFRGCGAGALLGRGNVEGLVTLAGRRSREQWWRELFKKGQCVRGALCGRAWIRLGKSPAECLMAEMKEQRGMADTVISVDRWFLSRIFVYREEQ